MKVLELIVVAIATNSTQTTSYVLVALSCDTKMAEKNKFATDTIDRVKTLDSNFHFLHLNDLSIDTVNEVVASLVNADTKEECYPQENIRKPVCTFTVPPIRSRERLFHIF